MLELGLTRHGSSRAGVGTPQLESTLDCEGV